jgi:hypothetical protein
VIQRELASQPFRDAAVMTACSLSVLAEAVGSVITLGASTLWCCRSGNRPMNTVAVRVHI